MKCPFLANPLIAEKAPRLRLGVTAHCLVVYSALGSEANRAACSESLNWPRFHSRNRTRWFIGRLGPHILVTRGNWRVSRLAPRASRPAHRLGQRMQRGQWCRAGNHTMRKMRHAQQHHFEDSSMSPEGWAPECWVGAATDIQRRLSNWARMNLLTVPGDG